MNPPNHRGTIPPRRVLAMYPDVLLAMSPVAHRHPLNVEVDFAFVEPRIDLRLPNRDEDVQDVQGGEMAAHTPRPTRGLVDSLGRKTLPAGETTRHIRHGVTRDDVEVARLRLRA